MTVGSVVQVVRDGHDDDPTVEQEGTLQEQRGLVVQEVLPPAAGSEFREHDRDEPLAALLPVHPIDVFKERA